MADGISGSQVVECIASKEITTNKFAINGLAAVGQRSGAVQAALTALTPGAKGTNTDAEFLEIYNMVVEIRSTLIANGMWKGSA